MLHTLWPRSGAHSFVSISPPSGTSSVCFWPRCAGDDTLSTRGVAPGRAAQALKRACTARTGPARPDATFASGQSHAPRGDLITGRMLYNKISADLNVPSQQAPAHGSHGGRLGVAHARAPVAPAHTCCSACASRGYGLRPVSTRRTCTRDHATIAKQGCSSRPGSCTAAGDALH